MRKSVTLPVLLSACLAASALSAAPAPGGPPLFVGTYTGGTSKGIYLYDFDSRTGHLTARSAPPTVSENPSWLTFSANRHFLYAVNENGAGQSDVVGRVSAFALDPATAQLTPAGMTPSLGSEPTYSSISKDGRFLFVANYSVLPDPGGTLAVLPIRPDGSLGEVTQIKTARASLVNPDRQASPHIHSAVSSPDGRFVYVQDLGGDRIHVYRYDPANPEAPLIAFDKQPLVILPPGSGPRHLVFAPDGKHAYLTLEMAGAVVLLDAADGVLTIKDTYPLAATGFTGQVGGGAVHFSPDGRFLDVLDRGTDCQVVSFSVAPDTGALTLVGRRSTEGKEPREFTFDATGKFVIVANQKSAELVVFSRDIKTGVVGKKVAAASVDQPSDVKFLPAP